MVQSGEMVDRDTRPPLTFSEHELHHFMAEALFESRKALPACQPNPPVGCVIVRAHEIVARGFTGPPGTAHAEAAALASLGPAADPRQLAIFVTLEPCAFVGLTPSCARTIVASGIRTVCTWGRWTRIRGMTEPDSRSTRSAGLDVHIGVLEQNVLGFLAPYLGSPSRT